MDVRLVARSLKPIHPKVNFLTNEDEPALQNYDRVSVVTVVFNGRAHIRETIESVLTQDYPHIEYIVIDGGSTDGTVELVRQYDGRIAHFSSEPDRGIYDAMNKGIAAASGNWINFMNAGDRFHEASTVSAVMASIRPGTRIAFGDVHIRYPGFERIERAGSPANLWRGMQFSHQSVFVELPYHRAHPYALKHPVTADLAFMYRADRAGVRFQRLDQVVASVVTGGVSEKYRVRAIRHSCEAVCDGRRRPLLRLYFVGRVADAVLRSFLKSILPVKFITWLIKRK